MNRFISALLTGTALLPVFWGHVVPGAPELCRTHSDGNFVTRFVTTGPNGETVPYASDDRNQDAQRKLCRLVEAFPA